jgi:hypothetical protein
MVEIPVYMHLNLSKSQVARKYNLGREPQYYLFSPLCLPPSYSSHIPTAGTHYSLLPDPAMAGSCGHLGVALKLSPQGPMRPLPIWWYFIFIRAVAEYFPAYLHK